VKWGRLVWLVPLAALAGAAFYLEDYRSHRGLEIILRFSEAEGVRPDQTFLQYRGVVVGQVTAVKLSEDHREVLVQVRLERNQDDFARKGAIFWIERPEVSEGGLRGLKTVFSGPYIESLPGSGEFEREFRGLREPPVSLEDGLVLHLRAPRLHHLGAHSPILYRGVQVGIVRDTRLGREANQVDIRILVWKRYAPLVRSGTRFWQSSGLDMKGGIISGIEFKLESLRALISGAVSFATPEQGEPVANGASFALEKEPQDEWLQWAPRISIAPISASTGEDEEALLPAGPDSRSKKRKE